MTHEPAVLVLEDGRTFTGRAYGAPGRALGEIVFNTGMTGYQETLTDPSYHRQIVLMTSPHIGNTGVNDEDTESARIWAAGLVVRDAAIRPSSWRATGTLEDALESEGVVAISDIDTRALTRHLRDRGVMRAGIFSGPARLDDAGRVRPDQDLLAEVTAVGPMTGAHLTHEVTTAEPYVVEPHATAEAATDGAPAVPAGPAGPVATIVAIDLGIKGMTPQRLAARGVRTHVLPATATIDDVLALDPDGVFFSNGPGDPAAATQEVGLLREVLDRRIPFFGICYGNQLLGRALGYGTYKLTYGHRGVNQPVLDRRTRKVAITSHNHGFAVDAPKDGESVAPHDGGRYGRVVVSHVALNDDVVEGLECLDLPAFSVQYHPEAAAGPHDADDLFDRFIELMRTHRGSGDAPAAPAGTPQPTPSVPSEETDAPSH